MQSKYINREISWLKFNARVLQEAIDKNNPLLERLRFLGIYSNNLDEFYKVRYATLVRLIQFGKKSYQNIVYGQSAEQLLDEINKVVSHQQKEYDRLYDEITEELYKEKIVIVNDKNLEDEHKIYIEDFFDSQLEHSLNIISKGSKVSIPFTKDGLFYLVVTMTKKASNKQQHAFIEVPTDMFPRFVVLPAIEDKQYVIFLEDIIRYHLGKIFQFFKYDEIEAKALKITKDVELSIDNDIEVSFLESVSESLKERKKGQTVRLVYDRTMNPNTLNKIKKFLNIDEIDNVSAGNKYLCKKDFMKFPTLGRKDLENKKIKPIVPSYIKKQENYFKAITGEELLLYMPYNDYSVFLKILRSAAIDPKVKTIKITIYRVADYSQILQSLINAARNGKDVTVVLELRARFDEEHNIMWSKKLQDYGVKVIFGVPGLKVHSKIGIIERVSQKGFSDSYAFVSTGNFHEGTAKGYTDFLLITADKNINKEIQDVFKFFEANYLVKNYKYLAVSPFCIRRKLIAGIRREIRNKKLGLPAQINIKVNSACDKQIIDLLYEASKNGVEVRMIVRGICSIIPKLKGLSENIEVISIVDKFLEHPRVYWFKNGGDDMIYISSADLMPRNLDYRIEVSCPVYSEINKEKIKHIFELGFSDNVKGRYIREGLEETYFKNDEPKNRSQESVYEYLKNIDK